MLDLLELGHSISLWLVFTVDLDCLANLFELFQAEAQREHHVPHFLDFDSEVERLLGLYLRHEPVMVEHLGRKREPPVLFKNLRQL